MKLAKLVDAKNSNNCYTETLTEVKLGKIDVINVKIFVSTRSLSRFVFICLVYIHGSHYVTLDPSIGCRLSIGALALCKILKNF